MPTAIGYIRVSDQRQAEDGSSLSTQAKVVRAYAENQGYSMEQLFIEEGESAKTDARPQLQEMLRYCRENKGKVQVLVVPKIDRLARNAHDYANLKLALAKCEVTLESVGERIEDSPVGRFTESIMASVAQFDNEIRAERSKGGMIEAVSEGRWVWLAPKGYQNVRPHGKGTIEPKPGESDVIRRAFEFLAGGSCSVEWVRAFLNENGVTVSRAMVYKLIKNKIYLGQIEAFGRVFEAKPPFVPLVSDAIFYAANAVIRQTEKPLSYKRNNPDFPLRGTARCSCGNLLTACWSQGKTKKYPYYRCMTCVMVNYQGGIAEAEFADELEAFSPAPERWDEIQSAIRLRWRERKLRDENSNQLVRQRIDKLVGVQKALAMKNATGVIPDDLARTQILELGRQIEQLSQGFHEASPQLDIDQALAFARDFLDGLGGCWKAMSVKNKKSLQEFMYPEGLLYAPQSGFRTSDYPLLEQVKQELSGVVSSVVAPNSSNPNSTADWILSLEAHFGHLSD